MKAWHLMSVFVLGMFFLGGNTQAQTLNGAPLLVTRQPNGNLLNDIVNLFLPGANSAQPTVNTSPLGQGVNAFGQPNGGPIARPMNVKTSSGKLSDYFFTPKTNLISNQTVVGRSYFPTQAQLPSRSYLNTFGFTQYNR